jgi:hypothetical protein
MLEFIPLSIFFILASARVKFSDDANADIISVLCKEIHMMKVNAAPIEYITML